MGDSISSDSDGLPTAPTVASILGIKGSLRFRPHGSSQKAHVVLRRVEISDDSSEDGDSKPVVYYSLFAQKRIEVKPGKEILLAVSSLDGTFKDQPVIFEGDLPSVDDFSDEDETHVIEEEDDTGLQPFRDVMPPKMRRAWGKGFEKVSPISIADSVPAPPRRQTSSIGIQVQPTRVSESVQACIPGISVCVQTQPEQALASILVQPHSDSSQPVSHRPSITLVESSRHASTSTKMQTEELTIQSNDSTQVADKSLSVVTSLVGERSLSPMDLDSAASTPLQSPALVVTKLLEMDSGMDTTVVAPSPTSSIASSSNGRALTLPVTDARLNIKDQSTAKSDLVPISPLQLEPAPSETVSNARTSTPEPLPAKPVTFQPRAISERKPVQSPAAHKPVVRNPFVSAGFIGDFLGTSRQTPLSSSTNPPPADQNNVCQVDDSPRQDVVTEPLVSRPTEIPSRFEGPSILSPASSVNAVASSSKAPMAGLPSKPKSFAASQRAREKSPALGYPAKQQAPKPAAPFSKRGPSQGTHQRVSPPDPKSLVHISQGPIANPLNIKPSSNGLRKSAHPLPAAPVIALTPPTAKKRIVVGSGWPHVRQSNGTASGSPAITPSAAPKTQVHIPIPIISPESPPLSRTREAPTTDTSISSNISKIVSYTSPSPPPSSQLMHSPSAGNWKPVTSMINEHQPTLSPIAYLNHSTRVQKLPHNAFIQDRSATPSASSRVPFKSSLTEVDDRSLHPRSTTERTSLPPHSRESATAITAKGSNQPTSTNTVSRIPGAIDHPPVLNHDVAGSFYRPDSRGLKRGASTGSQDVETLRPRQRRRVFGWPTSDNIHSVALKGEGDLGIRSIAFNSDGSQFALCCLDRTVRIWNNYNHREIARLTQYSHVVSVAWVDEDTGIVSLADDGMVSKWTRTGQNHWQWAKLLDAGNERRQDDECICFAYSRDRLAVAFPRLGVKVWIWTKGTWQPQRSILRQNVTSIKFVEDGEALLGGTRDGVLWYCQVPNGTLRAYTFLKSKIYSIDVNASESHALVAQIGGRSHLVGIRQDDHKGKIEQAYAIKDSDSCQASYEFGAVFASRGQVVLFGDKDGCILVWDKNKGGIAFGLDHGSEDVIQAVASFDGSPSSKDGYLITGTRQGQLTWWAQPCLDNL